jgi:hypothetical protein
MCAGTMRFLKYGRQAEFFACAERLRDRRIFIPKNGEAEHIKQDEMRYRLNITGLSSA